MGGTKVYYNKKLAWIDSEVHHELMILKEELNHKSISETINYLLYELGKGGFEDAC